MVGLDVPHGTYVHVCGVDIVRDETGGFLVLEDNARTPSGVSYVLENRNMMRRLFPDLMDGIRVRPVGSYGMRLQQALAEIAPSHVSSPQVVLLSPGVYNSAYFEHIFLAREMGVPLVEGRDLVVEDGRVWMRTTAGLAPVHSIYRRLNDDFLDPDVFRADSTLGVRGLIDVWRNGRVALANAVGTGVADDKAIYAYMPRIIRYYLDETPILSNVETHICGEPEGLRYTLDHLAELVVKPVGESGGYGLIIGPHASAAELDSFRAQLLADPANYISQPMISLSVSPHAGGRPAGAAPCRFAAVRHYRARYLGAARRPHAGGAAGRLAGGQFQPGRRVERYLGAGTLDAAPIPVAISIGRLAIAIPIAGISRRRPRAAAAGAAVPLRRESVLAGTLYGAGRESGAYPGRDGHVRAARQRPVWMGIGRPHQCR